MNAFSALAAFVLAAVISALLTAAVRRALLRVDMVDAPNERSLHRQPLPRGGGIAIAASVLLLHGGLLAAGALPATPGWAWWLIALGFLVLGWWDDRKSRPTLLRLLLQVALASAFIGVLHAGTAPGAMFAIQATVAVLALVWTVNLFNFMDGADGFAASQGIASAAMAACIFAFHEQPGAALAALILAGACAGFLCFNWPPARIFMGDSGSYFLGFELAACAGFGIALGQAPALWVIVLMPFIVDASLTLARRMLARRRWWQAHRDHAYQKLILGGWTARRLALALAALNLVLCWPLLLWRLLDPASAWWPAAVAAGVTAIMWRYIVQRGGAPA